jgi:hypothetical protein
MGNDRQTEIMELQNTATNAKRITTVSDDLFVQGYAFSVRDVYPALAATDTYFHIDPTATSDLQIVFEPLLFVGAEAGPMVVTLYVGPTLTAGGRTPLLVTNRRATSSNVSQIVAEQVAAANVSSPGTKFSSRILASASAGGSFADQGAASAGGLPFEIDPTQEYLVRVDNQNGTDGQVELNAAWFEVPTA